MNTATHAAPPGAASPLAPATEGAHAASCGPLCSHSLGTRLSRNLGLFTVAMLALVFAASWFTVGMLIQQRNAEDLAQRCELEAEVLALEVRSSGAEGLRARLQQEAPMRGHSRLQVWWADGRPLWEDKLPAAFATSGHVKAHDFTIAAPGAPGGVLKARLSADFSDDARMGRRWAALLAGTVLLAGAAVAWGTRWQVRRALLPLNDLAAQTRAISPQRLHQRLALRDPAEELLPWIDQFNALMARLEKAYAQLEAFNADVAHELRTPLAAIIGHTEVALSRERSNEELRDTLAGNLEEMQRLGAMVNDMLFLAQADRGAVARRGAPASLAALAQQVLDFHEATLEDAGLRCEVQGDAVLAVDEPLLKRALSNLLGNAARYADKGSTVVLSIAAEPGAGPGGVQVLVRNQGPQIEPQHLPRLFDRFFRADDSRCCPNEETHHGLGLAIVAAIARMHGGQPLAHSAGGTTQVGFTLARA